MADEIYEPDEPREFAWAGVQMYRCPLAACSWSHEDRDMVLEHMGFTGHLGPDEDAPVEGADIPSESRQASVPGTGDATAREEVQTT